MTDAQKAQAVIQAFTGAMAAGEAGEASYPLLRDARAAVNTMLDRDVAVLFDHLARRIRPFL